MGLPNQVWYTKFPKLAQNPKRKYKSKSFIVSSLYTNQNKQTNFKFPVIKTNRLILSFRLGYFCATPSTPRYKTKKSWGKTSIFNPETRYKTNTDLLLLLPLPLLVTTTNQGWGAGKIFFSAPAPAPDLFSSGPGSGSGSCFFFPQPAPAPGFFFKRLRPRLQGAKTPGSDRLRLQLRLLTIG